MRLLMQRHMETSNPDIWHITENGIGKIKSEIDDLMVKEGGKTLIAETKGRIVGFIQGYVVNRTDYTPKCVGFIGYLYVREPFRRRGIGTLLVRELCLFFETKGVQEVNLRYVLGNEEGETFWRSLGFKPIIETANITLSALKKRLS